MVTTWEIILTVIIVFLSIIMPIFYSYHNKNSLKKEIKPFETTQAKDYDNRVNEQDLNKS